MISVFFILPVGYLVLPTPNRLSCLVLKRWMEGRAAMDAWRWSMVFVWILAWLAFRKTNLNVIARAKGTKGVNQELEHTFSDRLSSIQSDCIKSSSQPSCTQDHTVDNVTAVRLWAPQQPQKPSQQKASFDILSIYRRKGKSWREYMKKYISHSLAKKKHNIDWNWT